MTKRFDTAAFRQLEALWTSGSADPTVAGGIPAGLGSVYLRGGSFPATPVELYTKLGGGTTGKGWGKQNLVNLRIYNMVTDFGAVGDGVTDNKAAFNTAVTTVNAAGGGAIYIPPAVLGYALTVNASGSNPSSIAMSNVHNIIFFGDGYNSFLKFTGSFLNRTQYMFHVHNGSTRIGFFNFRCSTSMTNPNDQSHYIQVSNDAIAEIAPASNVDIDRMWFDPIRGSALRVLGEPVLDGRQVSDVRFTHNAVNVGDGADLGRSCVEANRNSSRVMIHYNWLGPTSPVQQGQNIDFEPAGFTAPNRWSMLGNMIVSGNTFAVTLSGVDSPRNAAIRNTFSYNIVSGTRGGSVEAVALPTLFSMQGNIVICDGQPPQAKGQVLVMRDLIQAAISENIFVCLDTVAGGADATAVWIFSDAPQNPMQIVFTDNLIKATSLSTDATIRFEPCNQLILTDNMEFVDTAAFAPNGMVLRPVLVAGEDWIVQANMIVAIAGGFTSGLLIGTLGSNPIHNVLVGHNLIGTAVNGIQWDTTGFAMLDWRSCNGNITRNISSQAIVVPPTLVGVTMEGTAGSNAQVALASATPSGNVSASTGSFCMNTAGAAGGVLSIKESGTSTAGWFGDGAVEMSFGVLTANATTTDQFIAPGISLPSETAVEIQVALPRPGTLRNLRLQCVAGVGGGNNTFEVRKNGANTGLSLTVANTATTGTGTATAPTFAAGDLLSIRTSKTLAPGAPQTDIVLTLEITS